MLGKEDPQRGLFEAASQLDEEEIEEMGLYGQMARYGSELFDDEDFAHMYDTENGRPSTPPSLLARARLLQHYEDVSEREVVRRCKYDIRWKVALGLDLQTTEKPFARTTFQAFRYRLTMHDEEGLVFEKSLERAAEAGLLDEELEVALDSSPVRGRGAVEDAYQQISSQIGAVVRAVAKAEGTDVEGVAADWELSRHVEADSIKGTELVDWDDEEAVDEFLAGLLEEAARAVELAEAKGAGGNEVDLLERIIDEDIDEDPDDQDRPTVAEGTAEKRVVSTSDPEMRHGRKSDSGKYDGHKAHIGVDVESGLIVDVDMTEPAAAEGGKIEATVECIQRRTGCGVEAILGDSAYGTTTGFEEAERADVELKTKMAPRNTRSGQFGEEDFEVSEDGSEVTCPAGNEPKTSYEREGGWQHRFDPNDCQSCPLREQCTQGKQRTYYVGPYYHEKRRQREWAKSEQGRKTLRRRTRVEHAIGRLKQWGAGQARYFGRDKTKAQWQWTAAIANLSLLWNRRDRKGRRERTEYGARPPFFAERGTLRRPQRSLATPMSTRRRNSAYGRSISPYSDTRYGRRSAATYSAFSRETAGLRPAS